MNASHRRLPLTVASFSTQSSGAPNEASPISCENCANVGSAKSGTWPKSWKHTNASFEGTELLTLLGFRATITSWQMSGSGVYIGQLPWRMYCVEWNTRNAVKNRHKKDFFLYKVKTWWMGEWVTDTRGFKEKHVAYLIPPKSHVKWEDRPQVAQWIPCSLEKKSRRFHDANGLNLERSFENKHGKVSNLLGNRRRLGAGGCCPRGNRNFPPATGRHSCALCKRASGTTSGGYWKLCP